VRQCLGPYDSPRGGGGVLTSEVTGLCTVVHSDATLYGRGLCTYWSALHPNGLVSWVWRRARATRRPRYSLKPDQTPERPPTDPTLLDPTLSYPILPFPSLSYPMYPHLPCPALPYPTVSSTLHPPPATLFPTPYTLHPEPYIVDPKP